MDKRIEHINDSIELHKMWAQYWIGMATTGVAKDRKMYHGTTTDKPFTDEEKVEEALSTAQNHIHGMTELMDKKMQILNKKEGS